MADQELTHPILELVGPDQYRKYHTLYLFLSLGTAESGSLQISILSEEGHAETCTLSFRQSVLDLLEHGTPYAMEHGWTLRRVVP